MPNDPPRPRPRSASSASPFGTRNRDELRRSGMQVRKRELDREVALQLGKSPKVVGIITRVFLYEVMRELINMNAVRLDGLGELTIGVRRGKVDSLRSGSFTGGESKPLTVKSKRKIYVGFRKARPFNEAIRLKYGRAAAE